MSILHKLSGDDERSRKQQIEIISSLNRWYQVREDLLFAFEKAAASEIAEPANTYLNEFVARVKAGLEMETALKIMSDSYNEPSFKYILKQLEFNLKYRGKTAELLDDLESQMMKLDEEFTRRKISTSKDRKIINCIYILSPLLGAVTLSLNPASRHFFTGTQFGKMSMAVVFFLYLLSLLFYYVSGRRSGDA